MEAVALQGLDLTVQRAELMAIIGNSGSGKLTLLNILGGLDGPSAGKVLVSGRDLLKISDRTSGALQARDGRLRLAADFAQPLPYLTALQNVECLW